MSIEVLKKLTTFCMQNFIRHLSLYQTVFSVNQKECIDAKLIAVQSPMLLPSLAEACSYNGEEIGAEGGGTARSEYTDGEYEGDSTARTDYTEG